MKISLRSCRICLETSNLENIFKTKCDINDVPIWEKVVYCAAVQVSQGDSLPEMICNQCLYYLEIAYIFKTVCVATDKKLRCLHTNNELKNFDPTQCHQNIKHDGDDVTDGSDEYIKFENILDKKYLREKEHNKRYKDITKHEENLTDTLLQEETGIVADCNNKLEPRVLMSNSIVYQSGEYNFSNCIVEKLNINNILSKVNNEANDIVEGVNPDLEKDTAHKDILKVGRHIAKKITGKFPQKLLHSNNIDEKQQHYLKENLIKDQILLNDVNFGTKCNIIPDFEDILEDDLPTVGFEETVITAVNDFPFDEGSATTYCNSTNFEQKSAYNNNKEHVNNSNNPIINLHKENDKKDKTPENKLKISPMTLRRGNRKVNGFDDHKIKVAKIKRKTKDLIKKVKIIPSENIKGCFKCDVCSKLFPYRSHLDRHLNMHTGIKKYNCIYCEQKFINSYNLSVHTLKHTGQFPLKCELCNKGFSNPSLLKRHKSSHTGETNFQCRYCLVKFTQSSSLRLHEKMHLHRPSYHCDVCYKVFSYTNSLAAHRKLHFSTKRYTCNTCSSTFSRKSSLIRHIDGHSKSKRFKCKFCGLSFNIKNTYNLHLKSHCKYKCYICAEGFQHKINLVNHIKIHKNVLKCEQCFKGFPSNIQLVRHLGTHNK